MASMPHGVWNSKHIICHLWLSLSNCLYIFYLNLDFSGTWKVCALSPVDRSVIVCEILWCSTVVYYAVSLVCCQGKWGGVFFVTRAIANAKEKERKKEKTGDGISFWKHTGLRTHSGPSTSSLPTVDAPIIPVTSDKTLLSRFVLHCFLFYCFTECFCFSLSAPLYLSLCVWERLHA